MLMLLYLGCLMFVWVVMYSGLIDDFGIYYYSIYFFCFYLDSFICILTSCCQMLCVVALNFGFWLFSLCLLRVWVIWFVGFVECICWVRVWSHLINSWNRCGWFMRFMCILLVPVINYWLIRIFFFFWIVLRNWLPQCHFKRLSGFFLFWFDYFLFDSVGFIR